MVKVLGHVRVLRGVDASFDESAVHVVEGANGSGKSTLLSILAGRMRPSSGRALLQQGDAAVAEAASLRQVVGWLGHDLGLYADLDAFQNLALHARLRGLDPEGAWSEAAEALGVGALRGRRVREMSRGQRQRVALARTLLGDPPVLLLDEPSTGLDTAAVESLGALLRTLQARGRIVVAVTHDAAFARAVGGRAWRMADGKISPAARGASVSRETE